MATIKKINISGATYDIEDAYARDRIEGLTTVYSISCNYTKGATDTYVDWDTGADVAYADMSIRNGGFKSTADEITVSGTGTTSYLVLTSLKSANKYYVKKMTEMKLGDTVYVIESADVASDRWLSSFTSSPLAATFKALNEKIDLSAYALKTEAGKAGAYTTGGPSTNVTSSNGSHTAAGSATISYDKSANKTGSTGSDSTYEQSSLAGGHSINGSNFSFTGTAATISVSGSYIPEGTISQISHAAHSHTVTLTKTAKTVVKSVDAATGSAGAHTHEVHGTILVNENPSGVTPNYTPKGTINGLTQAAHSHAVNVSKATVNNNVTGTATGSAGSHSHTVTASGSISTATTGTANYTPKGSISAVSASNHAHSLSTHSHGQPKEVVGGYPSFSGGSLTGTKTFNTDAIKNVKLSGSATTSTGAVTYVESVTHTGASLTGTKTFNTNAIKDFTLAAGSHASDGPRYVYDITHTDVSSSTGSFNTNAYKVVTADLASGILHLEAADTVNAVTSISGGNMTYTYYYMRHENTAADTGTVGISGGSITPVTKYLTGSGDAASKASVDLTPASLGEASLVTVVGDAGAIELNTGEAGAFNVTPTFTGEGARLIFTGSQATTSNAANHTHSLTNSALTYVTGATLDTAGGFDYTPTFSGNAVLMNLNSGIAESAGAHTHSVGSTTISINDVTGATTSSAGAFAVTPTFTGKTASVQASGDYTPVGTIGGSQTISDHQHNYIKLAAHTHSIALTATQVTGTAAVAVSSHTHDLGNHTHSVTISPIKAS